ncbi:MAG: hypothetical protein WC483_04975 [Candidatus Paceibacterota bacterium]
MKLPASCFPLPDAASACYPSLRYSLARIQYERETDLSVNRRLPAVRRRRLHIFPDWRYAHRRQRRRSVQDLG